MPGINSLWDPPEQAGVLRKQSHSRSSWTERYFVLKDGGLFYFKNRQEAAKRKLHGCIPLDSAKIEVEAPPGVIKPGGKSVQHIITITLNTSHAISCKHPFYVLAAPTPEVQSAWVNALWQAAIPRASLIQHLQAAGRLADVVAAYAQQVQACFPVADAAVLSSGGRAKLNATVNVGTLAAMLRQNKAPQSSQDLRALPMALQDPVAAAHVLARTASGNVVHVPAHQVVSQDNEHQRTASGLSPGAHGPGADKPAVGMAKQVAVAAAAGNNLPTPAAAVIAPQKAAPPAGSALGPNSPTRKQEPAAIRV